MISFGTDFPVADYNPFPGIYTAVTRCDAEGRPTTVNPQEAMSISEALTAYTYGSACSIVYEK